MNTFIPREKMSRKARKELDAQRRVLWSVPPVTRTVPDKTKYNRKRSARIKHDSGAAFGFIRRKNGATPSPA